MQAGDKVRVNKNFPRGVCERLVKAQGTVIRIRDDYTCFTPFPVEVCFPSGQHFLFRRSELDNLSLQEEIDRIIKKTIID